MNTPNKLTLSRIFLMPVIVLFMFLDVPYNYLIAMVIFIVACITDMVDGAIARKKQLITNLGKFLDPLADKVLVCSVLICFVQLGFIHAAAVIIIITREFLVTAVRLAAVDKKVIIAAGIWGKLKTIIQISAIIAVFFAIILLDIFPVLIKYNILIYAKTLIWISVALTVISGIEYFIKNRNVLEE